MDLPFSNFPNKAIITPGLTPYFFFTLGKTYSPSGLLDTRIDPFLELSTDVSDSSVKGRTCRVFSAGRLAVTVNEDASAPATTDIEGLLMLASVCRFSYLSLDGVTLVWLEFRGKQRRKRHQQDRFRLLDTIVGADIYQTAMSLG